MSLIDKKTALMFAKFDGVFPIDWLERAKKEALCKFDSIGITASGFRSPKTLYINFTEENTMVGDYIYLMWTKADRKIPKATLELMMRREIDATKKSNNVNTLSQKILREIKQGIEERESRNMPVSCTDIPFIIDTKNNKVFIEATSDKNFDMLVGVFLKAFEVKIEQVNTESLAYPNQLADYTIKPSHAEVCPLNARNFMTWLWFKSEIVDGMNVYIKDFIELEDNQDVVDIKGSKTSVIKKADCANSVEAKMALLSGKKLKRANVYITLPEDQEMVFSGIMNADNLTFSSFEFPEGEEMGDEKAIERIESLLSFEKELIRLFACYQTDTKDIKHLEDSIRAWANDKANY